MKKFRHHYYNSLLKEADSNNGTVDHIDLSRSYLRELPDFFKDLYITSDFDVSENLLTSCKNFPKTLGGFAYINDNKISSLEGLRRLSSRIFDLTNNKLTSLEYFNELPLPRCKLMLFGNNQITSCKGLENIFCEKLIMSNNEISSWEYLPKGILNQISFGNNKLTSWKGMPEGLKTLYVNGNWDVKDFEDYKEVRDTLVFTTSHWNSRKELTSVVIANHMRSKGITPPHDIFPGYQV